ncbi:unnamed protein product [Phaedon cochleariae]|uniref:Major facilitator superfamily associated domain-containing protein n=1 Tax=Phaedon cochleariae TaxID=80249 RepID=A0A9N9X0E3_PHACE|nr:unnamed protein product [Phaedon cochleariae]
MKKIVVNKQLVPMKAHYFLWNAGTGALVSYFSSYARQLGFSSVVVGFIYTILPISGMLAKPIFGMIADKFRCQKLLFLMSQLLTAAAFLAIFFVPKLEIERKGLFSCQNDTPIIVANATQQLSDCDVSHDDTIGSCKMGCDVNKNLANSLCNEWNLIQYCGPGFPNLVYFNIEVPKSRITQKKKQVTFEINNITLTDGSLIESACPVNQSITTFCSIECNDYYMNDIITKPALKDDETYSLYQFWTFLILMMVGWVGQAIAVSIGDAICFQLLGDKPSKYGYQRLFGALGWGSVAAITGILIDALSEGKAEKDYSAAFYLATIFIVLDFIVSSRLMYTQVEGSSNIIRDVGTLLLNIRIISYLVWCIFVGMCTGLMWQFLFWLIEDLAAQGGCESQAYVKTLEGLVQAIQSLAGEAPFFFLSGRIMNKIGHENTMSLVLLAIGIRFILYSVIANPWYFLPIELLNGITIGLAFACLYSYASIVAPPGTEATMQGVIGAVFEGIGVSSGSALAGLSYRSFGGALTFRYFGFASLALCVVHVAFQYFLKLQDYKTEYCIPKAALEKLQCADNQEYKDSVS